MKNHLEVWEHLMDLESSFVETFANYGMTRRVQITTIPL